MCVQTRYSLYEKREMFLRENLLFSLLICETYNLLTVHKQSKLTAPELYQHLSNFLKARISHVFETNELAKHLFKSNDDMVAFVVSMLSEKCNTIETTENYYYYQ